MKYAIIRSGGKQYKVTEGDSIEVAKLDAKVGEDVVFSDVLLYVSGNPQEAKIGKPVINGIVVKGKVLATKKGEKIRVAKFLAKSRYRRVHGHRDFLTVVKIEHIGNKEVKLPKPKIPAKEAKLKRESTKKK